MGGRRLQFVYPLLQSCGLPSRTVGCTSLDLMDHPPLRCNAGRHLLASGRREPHGTCSACAEMMVLSYWPASSPPSIVCTIGRVLAMPCSLLVFRVGPLRP